MPRCGPARRTRGTCWRRPPNEDAFYLVIIAPALIGPSACHKQPPRASAEPTVHDIMKDKVDANADALWDLTNPALANDANLDPSKHGRLVEIEQARPARAAELAPDAAGRIVAARLPFLEGQAVAGECGPCGGQRAGRAAAAFAVADRAIFRLALHRIADRSAMTSPGRHQLFPASIRGKNISRTTALASCFMSCKLHESGAPARPLKRHDLYAEMWLRRLAEDARMAEAAQ